MELAPWYTWVFDGIGVLLVSAVAGVIWRSAARHLADQRRSSKLSVAVGGSSYGSPIAYGSNIVQNVNLGTSPIPKETSSEYRSTPTPEQIRDRLSSLPPFQQMSIKGSYRGLKVRWTLYFASLSPLRGKDGEEYNVLMTRTRHNPASNLIVSCHVPIADFPRLQIAALGDAIVVTGTIAEVDYMIILRDAHLDFPESTRDDQEPRHVFSQTSSFAGRLGEIYFDYLPSESPENHGWAVALDQGGPRPTCSIADDSPYAEKCLFIQGAGYRMDHALGSAEGLCKPVAFSAKLTDTSAIYPRVKMTGRDGHRHKEGWLAHKLAGSVTAARVDEVEWTLTDPGELVDQSGWRMLTWSLPEEVERTFGTQGWTYHRLLSIRLRGTVSISPIKLLE